MRTAAFFLLLAGAVIPLASPSWQQAPGTIASPAKIPAQTPLQPAPTPVQVSPPRPAGLNLVVLDPAHGGTDPGAHGVAGIRESDLVLVFAAQIRASLEKQGFSVVQTRQGNDNRTFDERSALANASRGAIFLTLHVGSTGLAETVRVYTLPDSHPAPPAPGALLPWDRAQVPFLPLSRKLADLTQAELSQQFKGSPATAQTAAIRQLKTIAAPAIAVEISSVSVDDREALDRMGPGLADAIARAITAFKRAYDAAQPQGALP